MSRKKFDGLVVGVHYASTGKIEWIRLYERRGATFSDLVHISREEIIARMKEGQKFVTGKRVPLMASTFDVNLPLRLEQGNGKEILVVGDPTSKADHLEGVPRI